MTLATMTDPELARPVSLYTAARILKERFPRYSYTRDQLRCMVLANSIPYRKQRRCGMQRRYTYTVCIVDLLRTFEQQERAAR